MTSKLKNLAESTSAGTRGSRKVRSAATVQGGPKEREERIICQGGPPHRSSESAGKRLLPLIFLKIEPKLAIRELNINKGSLNYLDFCSLNFPKQD